ncbi:IS3 family transposase [Buttiauxella ferragutiae]|uniref:IS3 family transposase n=1 Tax=Buttiauxella ferragutiae TaxID=82989 RepID=UPI003525603B
MADEVRFVFHEHKGRYGCNRIKKLLETKHIRVNHKRIARVMRQQGLREKGARNSLSIRRSLYAYVRCVNQKRRRRGNLAFPLLRGWATEHSEGVSIF